MNFGNGNIYVETSNIKSTTILLQHISIDEELLGLRTGDKKCPKKT